MRHIALFAGPAQNNWNPFNLARIQEVVLQCGQRSPQYDPEHPPYAVFDWDNTSVFQDVEEATFVYQLQHVRLAATPAQLKVALTRGVPADPEVENLTADILDSYAWLCAHRGQESPHIMNFASKYRLLYNVLDEKYGAPVSYPWLTYRFVGMTETQVRQLTHEALHWQRKEPIGKVTWTSPASLPGRAGVVQVTWSNGLRLLPEMQNLFQLLRSNGIDVWVCTASFLDGIREVSSNPEFGYANPADRVIGMELERDAEGRIQADFRHGYEMTYAKGKTRNIERFLVARYGCGPVLVAGDSNGDANMLEDFVDTRISLIIDAKRDPASAIGKLVTRARAMRGQANARYLVQDRDEARGCFLP